MFHWCPEETAAAIAAAGAVKVSWTHRRAIWTALKGKLYAAVQWLRAKLGVKDERHCCLHVAKNRAPVMTKAELLLCIEDVKESYKAARQADRVTSIRTLTRWPSGVLRPLPPDPLPPETK
jgi:hypothetical protein